MMLLPLLLAIPSFVSAAVYTVGVGKDETTGRKGIGFDPSAIHPQAGDTIVFEFRSGTHSVVASSFDAPCTPSGGFDSGVFTVAADLEVDAQGLPTATLEVSNTDPIWLFDQASGECTKGAVLSVNPTLTQQAGQFKENSLTATEPPASSSTESAGDASSTGTSDAASPSNSASSNDDTDSDAATQNAVSLFAVVSGILFLALP